MARIDIPRNPTELIVLADKIQKKHAELAAESPLKAIERWTERGAALEEATKKDGLAAQLVRDTDLAYEQRDLEIERAEVGVRDTVRQVRDLLLALHPKNPAKLGEYGFDVSDTPIAAPEKPPGA